MIIQVCFNFNTNLDVDGFLKIYNNATLDISLGDNLEIAGDFENYGTFTTTDETTTLNGTLAQALTGNITFYNLTIDNSHVSKKVTPGSAITVSSLLTVTDGIFVSAVSDFAGLLLVLMGL